MAQVINSLPNKAAKMLGRDITKMKIITCHLGNGSSMAAILNGISVDTSMGFTPVDGLIMGTRTGEIDPGILIYLADKEHLNFTGVSNLINKKSGLAGISQLSSDMRDLEMAASEGNPKARLALRMFAYRVKKYIGAYSAAMNGLDLAYLYRRDRGERLQYEEDDMLRPRVSGYCF